MSTSNNRFAVLEHMDDNNSSMSAESVTLAAAGDGRDSAAAASGSGQFQYQLDTDWSMIFTDDNIMTDGEVRSVSNDSVGGSDRDLDGDVISTASEVEEDTGANQERPSADQSNSQFTLKAAEGSYTLPDPLGEVGSTSSKQNTPVEDGPANRDEMASTVGQKRERYLRIQPLKRQEYSSASEWMETLLGFVLGMLIVQGALSFFGLSLIPQCSTLTTLKTMVFGAPPEPEAVLPEKWLSLEELSLHSLQEDGTHALRVVSEHLSWMLDRLSSSRTGEFVIHGYDSTLEGSKKLVDTITPAVEHSAGVIKHLSTEFGSSTKDFIGKYSKVVAQDVATGIKQSSETAGKVAVLISERSAHLGRGLMNRVKHIRPTQADVLKVGQYFEEKAPLVWNRAKVVCVEGVSKLKTTVLHSNEYLHSNFILVIHPTSLHITDNDVVSKVLSSYSQTKSWITSTIAPQLKNSVAEIPDTFHVASQGALKVYTQIRNYFSS